MIRDRTVLGMGRRVMAHERNERVLSRPTEQQEADRRSPLDPQTRQCQTKTVSPISANYEQLRSCLILGLIINAFIIVLEFLGGYLTNSLGLMGDAGHNLIDQSGLFLALWAHMLAARPATETRTYGYHRAGIIAAFLNGFILLVTAAVLTIVAIQRVFTPVPVAGKWVIGIAVLSFVANLTVALLLQRAAIDDLNIRGAFWHMLADAWISLGVAACGVGILFTGWTILDPLISMVIVVVIAKGAWPFFRESLEVLLESTPPGVDLAEIANSIERIEGVRNVHDLHIWAVEPRLVMLTCHVAVDPDHLHRHEEILHAIRSLMSTRFGIHHLTIQVETECLDEETIHCDLSRITSGPSPQVLHPHSH
ncbi:MAG: cation transporter [Nitrospirae bacterium]|nr:MAG: cation transporter [Nitrospirota bacterium]